RPVAPSFGPSRPLSRPLVAPLTASRDPSHGPSRPLSRPLAAPLTAPRDLFSWPLAAPLHGPVVAPSQPRRDPFTAPSRPRRGPSQRPRRRRSAPVAARSGPFAASNGPVATPAPAMSRRTRGTRPTPRPSFPVARRGVLGGRARCQRSIGDPRLILGKGYRLVVPGGYGRTDPLLNKPFYPNGLVVGIRTWYQSKGLGFESQCVHFGHPSAGGCQRSIGDPRLILGKGYRLVVLGGRLDWRREERSGGGEGGARRPFCRRLWRPWGRASVWVSPVARETVVPVAREPVAPVAREPVAPVARESVAPAPLS
ncbi:unnamed protein product, partial [Closterium sp. NIES-54]